MRKSLWVGMGAGVIVVGAAIAQIVASRSQHAAKPTPTLGHPARDAGRLRRNAPSRRSAVAPPSDDAGQGQVNHAIDAGLDAGIDPRCARYFAEGDTLVHREGARANYDLERQAAEFHSCLAYDRGTWTYLPVDPKVGPPDEETAMGHDCRTVSIDLELVHVDANGHRTSLRPSEGAAAYTEPCGWGDRSFSTPHFFDFDGDGDPEVYLTTYEHDEGGGDARRYLYTFKDGRIVPYGPAARLSLKRWEDVDHDGRPDFVNDGLYESVTYETPLGFDEPFVTDLTVAHSLPDGTFSEDDAVARSFFLGHCGADSRAEPLGPPPYEPMHIVCAAANGRSSFDLIGDVHKNCPEFCDAQPNFPCQTEAGTPACFPWYLRLAGVSPPFVRGGDVELPEVNDAQDD